MNQKHGMRNTSIYRRWSGMKDRCCNPKSNSYELYGGRGIRVCEKWMTFENFYADMGHPPSPKHQLNRIDNDGDYAPGNCNWATSDEQNKNRRSNIKITYQGKTQVLKDWARELGIGYVTLWVRIGIYKWPVEKAFTYSPAPRFITFQGKTQSITAWAKEIGLKPTTLYTRLTRDGWSVERALTS